MNLERRACLITGAAQGIGAATAEALARRGARLVLADVQADRVREVAERLPTEAIGIEMDVRDQDAVDAGVATAAEHFGGLDVLVNNAGVGLARSVPDLDDELWQLTIDVNLTGPYRLVKAALPELRRSRGHIATVASMAARQWVPRLAHYSATKAGVAAFSETLRIELADDGIGITTVYFGTIDTPMVQRGVTSPDITPQMRRNLEVGRKLGFAPLVPVERAGEAIARGIEEGRRAVFVPRRSWLMFHLSTPIQRVFERMPR